MYDWVQSPYSGNAGHPESLTLKEEEELCALQCDRTLKFRLTDLSMDKLRISVTKELPTIHRKAIHIVAVFNILHA